MSEGTVRSWVSDRQCGLISVNKLKKEILVKSSNLKGTSYLEEGEKVRFIIKETKRGPIAINVEPLNC
ncbi:MAG: cold shock domain-containing protein [Candidatus Bathyarchaeota archaeon]